MRILLIEDEILFAELINEALNEEGYIVDIANDGESGLWHALSNDYSLILLDLGLPDIDGMELCSKIRKACPDVVIFILSARGKLFDRVKALDIGADDYLTKPFQLEELFARIRALLRRHGTTRLPILELGSLSVDPASKTVSVNQEEIKLTPTEYSLLSYLLRHAGSCVSQEELIRNSWDDFGSSLYSTTIRTHISNLRRKLLRAGLIDIEICKILNQGYVLRRKKNIS